MGGTVTLMFTDLVGSTELLDHLGEDGAADLRRRHFALVRTAIARASGTEVKNLGDGVMAVFDSTTAAIACAREIQRGSRGDVGVRIGVHAGEPDREEGDYFGTPVVIASRLCARATAGQILASDVVRVLGGRRAETAFRAVGPVSLKGLSDPVVAWEIDWEDDEDPQEVDAPAPATAPALPEALDRDDGTFVGRTEALEHLLGAVDRGGGLRLAMLSGEPGIGKSRLSAEVAKAAHAGGAVVLFGRCDEEALIPYQPFAEAVGSYLAATPGAAPLAAGLERLSGAVPMPRGTDVDPGAERLMLFEAFVSFLGRVAETGPLLLILDDLHWADGPTLTLLRHLLRRGSAIDGVVLGTYRDTDLSRTHPLAAVLGELRREQTVDRVHLGGLDEAEVGRLLAAAAGHEPPHAFVGALHAESEGNPFFVEEIVRHLIEAGAIVQRDGRWTSDRSIEDMGIPEGVREAVGRRLAHLSESANKALAAASVLGRRFEFDVLAAMSGLDEDGLLDALDAALEAQLVVAADDNARAAYAFRHALVRETLYEELSLPRRQRLHLRAAEAIEQVHARDADAQAGALALHLRQAGAAVEPERALEWTLRAAAASAAQLAWEEAAVQLDAALELMEDADTEPGVRARVLEQLADLRYVTNVDIDAGLHCHEEALRLYESAGMTDRAARVHSKIGRDRVTYWGSTMDIPRGLEHLEAAAAVLDRGEPSTALAAIDIAVATAELGRARSGAAREASARALEAGRALDRPLITLNAEILDAFLAAGQGEGDGFDRLERAWQEADRRNHPWLAFLAAWCHGPVAFWTQGPAAEFEVCRREFVSPRSATAQGQRRMIGNFWSRSTALRGDLAEAAALVAEFPLPEFGLAEAAVMLMHDDPTRGREQAEAAGSDGVGAGNVWTATLANLWIAEARVGEGDLRGAVAAGGAVLAALDKGGYGAFADIERPVPVWRAVLAGELDAARARMASITTDFEPDTIGGARVALATGALAAADGRRDAAIDAFARSIEAFEQIGALWWALEARRVWGVLTRQTDPLDAAIAGYERIGAAPAWAELARAERAQVAG
jgi:hypothetical protein